MKIIGLSPCLLMLGCSYYDASLLDPHGSTSDGFDASVDISEDSLSDTPADLAPDGSTDVRYDAPVPDAPAEEAASCGHARPPDPPTSGDDGGDIDAVVAISQIDFGDASGNPAAIGYDLDFRCTCHGEANGCFRESWATADACDGPDGRDNGTGALIATMSGLFLGFGSQAWNQAIVAGDWSVLLRIRGYNGKPNDSQVRLDWYMPEQYWQNKPDETYVPAWDGNDAWPIRSWSLIEQEGTYDIDSPRFFDEYAYVTNGVLVGSLPNAALQVSANYEIQLTSAFLTAKLVEGSLGWTLEGGLMAARWKLDDILAQASLLEFFGAPVCTDHPAYTMFKKQVCSYADIYAGVGSPTTPCDAISVGLAFESIPAKLGEIWVAEPDPPACPPAVDPANDTCSNL